MSETNAPEPTMEEILASIRRIISEDDQPAAKPAAVPEDDGVLELTDKVDAATPDIHYEPEATPTPAESIGDLDVFSAPPTAPAPVPPAPPAPPAPAYAPGYDPSLGAPVDDEPLVSQHAAEAAASRFSQLAQSFALPQAVAMPPSSLTLDAVIREMLRPMLKEWLDQHLEGIVDARVQAEVERISRRH